jgi:hypothetical protein
VGVGEIWSLFTRAVSKGLRCGCGSSFAECPFWTAVNRHFGDLRAVADSAVGLKRQTLRFRRLSTLMGWPGPQAWRVELSQYRSLLTRIYDAVCAAANVDTVIDSSKSPLYALALAGLEGIQLDVVHIVRDPRAVAFSDGHPKRRQDQLGTNRRFMPRRTPMRSAEVWLYSNALVHAIRSRSYKRLRYEDLTASPTVALTSLFRALGLQSDLSFIREPFMDIGAGHGLAGNPSRAYQTAIKVQPDDRWLRGMAARDTRIVRAMTIPLAILYGYQGHRRQNEYSAVSSVEHG